MPTDKPRIMITLPEKLFQEIEDFRFDYRYQTRSDAVLALIRIGLRFKDFARDISESDFEHMDYQQVSVQNDPKVVNEMLRDGWVLLSVGFLHHSNGEDAPRFVLGLPKAKTE